MSASINQSVYSTKSFIIPDTMVNDDIQEENEEDNNKEAIGLKENAEKTNGIHKENGTVNTQSKEEEVVKETVIIPETLVIPDTLPSDELNENITNCLENKSSFENGSDKIVTETNGESIKETIPLETQEVVVKSSSLVEKVNENMIIDE